MKPLSILDRSQLARAKGLTVDASISGGRYWVLPPAPEVAVLDADQLHEVDSVELQLDSGSVVRIRWAMVGADEGLALEVDPDPLTASDLDVIDVGGTARWAALLGQPVAKVRAAWHVSDDNRPELL